MVRRTVVNVGGASYDFLSMGGYAFYVWSAYGIVAVVLIVNCILPLLRERRLLRRLALARGYLPHRR